MQAQESIIATYMDKLILRLHEVVARGKNPVNLRDWYTWTTFDVIGDLALGDSFDCLEGSDYHPWVRLFSGLIREQAMLGSLTSLGLRPVGNFLAKYAGALGNRKQHTKYTEIKVKQRMELGSERLDLIEGLVKKKAEVVSIPTPLRNLMASNRPGRPRRSSNGDAKLDQTNPE